MVWLCRECHRWVESRRTLAYGLGLLVRHGVTTCSAVPVLRHGRWVLLISDGLVNSTDAGRVLEIDQLNTITPEVVEAAGQTMVVGAQVAVK